jgi:heme oxygenase
LDISLLRAATANDHAAVEGSIPLMTDDLTVEVYISCLSRIHGVVQAWETAALASAPEWLKPTLLERQREGMLRRDLEWFGVRVDADENQPEIPEMNDTASLLGAMYVMEGSTLGGQLIARHVEQHLPLATHRGVEFFRGHREQTGPLWKEFCEILRTRVPDTESDAVIRAAKQMFSTFGSWMETGTLKPSAGIENNRLGSEAATMESSAVSQ